MVFFLFLSRLTQLNQRFDDVKKSGNMLPTADVGMYTFVSLTNISLLHRLLPFYIFVHIYSSH